MKRIIGFCVTGLLLVISESATATDFSKPIPQGSSFADVLDLWGEPVEKVEEGVLNKTIWYYNDGAQVVFKKGRAQSFRPTKATTARESAMRQAQIPVRASPNSVDQETADLLGDIAKEVPSGPDVPFSEPRGQVEPPIVPSQRDAGARRPPPAIVAADDELLEEDEDSEDFEG